MQSLTIKLPPGMKARLEAHAKLSGKSVSALVRQCIEQSPTMQDRTENSPSLYDLAKDLCGCFDSGVTDVSTNPRHMKGFGEWRK